MAPYTGISLKEKQETTELLLKAGADIQELNAVRKHASLVKGGRLAEIAAPATIESLILSDVIGDPPDVIASGPTAPDSATYARRIGVIEKFRLDARSPAVFFIFLLKAPVDASLKRRKKATLCSKGEEYNRREQQERH